MIFSMDFGPRKAPKSCLCRHPFGIKNRHRGAGAPFSVSLARFVPFWLHVGRHLAPFRHHFGSFWFHFLSLKSILFSTTSAKHPQKVAYTSNEGNLPQHARLSHLARREFLPQATWIRSGPEAPEACLNRSESSLP